MLGAVRWFRHCWHAQPQPGRSSGLLVLFAGALVCLGAAVVWSERPPADIRSCGVVECVDLVGDELWVDWYNTHGGDLELFSHIFNDQLDYLRGIVGDTPCEFLEASFV